MKNEKTDAVKEQRVVLNLNMAQAKELNAFLKADGNNQNYTTASLDKISNRIEKTINKHETEGAIAGVITAAQEVINEQEGDKCPSC
jgi:ribosome-associated translation inhibitor RaiA